ncbi:drug resistance transporter, EmrB/QacA subfamily [Saccharopolyspora kobensis]|uniref:Drug resistance transporter, EmrB/QacA subfamily n=1 Tax=Saccharopolyspora kobensis TaxID=146035 RepID=A0A1H6EIK1_9PSEU|nr:drug resistance transporter, EmrB/QacA subfamily [Saccharopolyspora kobensis]SFE66754.1 drug resistance transporter, EmrB/QacA subfamily [Saccharopolyspora kobensis]
MVSAAQLLVVLDGTIVNIALPSAQAALGISDADRQWAVTAYALAFGGLLLIGGRVSGALGHRRGFVVGLAGFGVASALGGLAFSPGMLFGARALQGVFAALLAPAGLSLLASTFTESRERGRAFGVFAGVGAAGAAVGLIAGGLLTEYAGWRWCFYINVPVVALALAGAVFVPRSGPQATGRLDVVGAVLSTAGFVSVVFAFSEAESRGWGSAVVLALLACGVLLLVAFVVVELRVSHPLLPIHVFRDRARGGAFISITLMFVAMFGFYLFTSYYAQTVLGWSPVRTGLALITNAVAALVGSTLIAGKRRAPAALIVPGLIAAAAGMLVLTLLTPESTHVFALYLAPALVLTGLGIGCVMPPTASLATAGIAGHEVGAASAAYNAAQQIGAALGTALLNSIATSAAASHPDAGSHAASVHGYTTALTFGFGILAAAALIAAPLTASRARAAVSS